MRGNQFKKIDWDSITWDDLPLTRKRERMFKESNFACSECGFDKRRPDGKMILEIDHIDSVHTNNSKENLRVLCPNCHAMTPHYRNHGRGKGRSSSRLRASNVGYWEARAKVLQEQQNYIEYFKSVVMETHASGEIDYMSRGWIQRLTEKLDENCNNVSRRIRRDMPDFFMNNCLRCNTPRRRKVD
jgi:hypothetical protein